MTVDHLDHLDPYTHDLGSLVSQALTGARAGKRVALLVSCPLEQREVVHAIHAALIPGETDTEFVEHTGYRKGIVYLGTEGRVHVMYYENEPRGCLYDLIVEGRGVYPDLQKEARGRLVGALQ